MNTQDTLTTVFAMLRNGSKGVAIVTHGDNSAWVREFYGCPECLEDLERSLSDYETDGDFLSTLIHTDTYDDPQQFSPDGRRELPACWLWEKYGEVE